MSDFRSVQDIVDAFGGLTSLANALNEVSDLGLTKGNVANWRSRNNLPAQYDLFLVKAARRKAIPLTLNKLAKMRALSVAPA